MTGKLRNQPHRLYDPLPILHLLPLIAQVPRLIPVTSSRRARGAYVQQPGEQVWHMEHCTGAVVMSRCVSTAVTRGFLGTVIFFSVNGLQGLKYLYQIGGV